MAAHYTDQRSTRFRTYRTCMHPRFRDQRISSTQQASFCRASPQSLHVHIKRGKLQQRRYSHKNSFGALARSTSWANVRHHLFVSFLANATLLLLWNSTSRSCSCVGHLSGTARNQRLRGSRRGDKYLHDFLQTSLEMINQAAKLVRFTG